MANELTKAEQNALRVEYEVNGAPVVLDLDFVKRYLVSGDADRVTDQEVLFYMNTCKMQKLNPLVSGESYLIKYGDKPAQLVVGKTAYVKRAFKNPNYLYKKDGIVVKRRDDYVKKQGCAVYPGEELIAGWCEVFYKRNGSEYSEYKETSLGEYNSNQANWKSKPALMINKVATAQCLREAFPDEYEGLYSEDELVASGTIPVYDHETGTIIEEKTEPVSDDPIITQEQRQELVKVYNDAKKTIGREQADAIFNIIKEKGYSSTSHLPSSVCELVVSRLMEAIMEKEDGELARQAQDSYTEVIDAGEIPQKSR